MDEIYWKILDAIASLSWRSGIYIEREDVIEKIGIADGEYIDRITVLQKTGLLDLASGGVATLTSEGRLALLDKKESERKKELDKKEPESVC